MASPAAVRRPRPVTPAALVDELNATLLERSPPHPLRVALDGVTRSGLDLAGPLAEQLRARGRPVVRVDTRDFLRPASVRLELGRDDPDAFYERWFDVDALVREVLVPLGPGGSGRMLPTLWDAGRDRATRAAYVAPPATAVVLVEGELLLRLATCFDVTVHLALSPAARARRTPRPDAARELGAFGRYEREVAPAASADVVVRCDDPRRPAVLNRLAAQGRR